MRYVISVFSAMLFFALGWAVAATCSVQTNLQWLVTPLAILGSASVTLLTAWVGWSRARKSEIANRTISYLLNEFPLSRELRESLGRAQKKIMEASASFAVPDSNASKLIFHIDIYEQEMNKLKDDERESLEKMADVLELICLNVQYGYFDRAIVERHLGDNYGAQFWIRSWPFIVYSNKINDLYMAAKGVNVNSGGIYRSLTERMLSLKVLEKKYPLYGERVSEEVEFDGITTTFELTL